MALFHIKNSIASGNLKTIGRMTTNDLTKNTTIIEKTRDAESKVNVAATVDMILRPPPLQDKPYAAMVATTVPRKSLVEEVLF